MATYYARNVTGNWSATSSWDTTSSGGAGPAGPPVAGDTAIFDSGFTGNITVAGTSACATITVQAGATGTLTLNAIITTTAGVTLVTGFNVAGNTAGNLRFGGSQTVTTAGLAIPNVTMTASSTITLGSDLNVTGTLNLSTYATTFVGAYDITCGTFMCYTTGGNVAHTFVSGQTLTVSTAMRVINVSVDYTITLKSSTASSDTSLHFDGAASACIVSGVTFTDVNCAHDILNWNGGTLTRTTGIYNVTSTSFPAVADVQSGVEYGGADDASANRLTGTFVVPAAEDVESGVQYGAGGTEFTGTLSVGGGSGGVFVTKQHGIGV